MIGTNGVQDGADVARMALAGACAVEVLSVVMLEGFAAITRINRELHELLAARGVTFADIVGRAADQLQGYAEQAEMPGRWREFVPASTLDGA